MPPPADHPCLQLSLLPNHFYVVQSKNVDQDVLQTLLTGSEGFFSVTRTTEEVSIVGEASDGVPSPTEANWRCIKVAGPMDFGLTGVMSALTAPLAKSGVPVFAVSTWNTDYLLVPKDKAEYAKEVLRKDGMRKYFDAPGPTASGLRLEEDESGRQGRLGPAMPIPKRK